MSPKKNWIGPKPYGAAVLGVKRDDKLGKEMAARQMKADTSGESKYGPAVLDPDYGKAVTETDPENVTAEKTPADLLQEAVHALGEPFLDAVPSEIDPAFQSVANLKKNLDEESPEVVFNGLLVSELFRKPKPRTEALRHFLALENKREGGAREAVVTAIDLAFAVIGG